LFFALSSSNPASSARIRHEAGTRHRTTRIDTKLMSYAQSETATKLAAFYSAVTAQQEESYLQEISYLKGMAYIGALAMQRSAEAGSRPQAVTASLPVPSSSGSDATSTNTPDWACIRQHESNGDYSVGGGGAYQFELGTWEGLTGLNTPAEDSPPSVQDAAALKLYAERGWEPWTTRYVCGL
jgi:hypothetical protein